MATLEKIRSKSGLLLIVIGVALLAFIIGDFFNSSQAIFGPDLTAAKAGDVKIDINELNTEIEKQSRQINGNLNDEQREALAQQVLQNMLLEKLAKEEYEKLGLVVSDEELNALAQSTSGLGDALAAQYGAQYAGLRVQSFAELYSYTHDNVPAEESEMRKNLWNGFENFMAEQLLGLKFQSMLSGTMPANKLDLAQYNDDSQTAYTINIATKPYTNNQAITVSDEELQKAWEENKYNYKIDEETRLISYITVDVKPDPADEDAAHKAAVEVVEKLNASDKLEGLKGQKGFASQTVVRPTKTFGDLQTVRSVTGVDVSNTARLEQFVDSAAVGSADIVYSDPNNIMIAKLLARGNKVDSLKINLVAIPGEVDAATVDSVMTAINSGKNAAEINTILNGLGVAQDSLPISLYDLSSLPVEISGDITGNEEKFLTAALGEAFEGDTLSSTGSMRIIYTVVERGNAVDNAEVALINYEINPSKTTINNLNAKLQDYISKNGNADDFVKNAANAGYNVQYALISASTPYIIETYQYNPYTGQPVPVFMHGSTKGAKWAMDISKGSVSNIFDNESSLLVVALNDVYNDYITASNPQTRTELTNKVRAGKEGDQMVKQYAGKATDVAGYAALMGVEPISNPVNFVDVQRMVGPEVAATIATTTPGKLVGPMKGQGGVSVFVVEKVDAPVTPAPTKGGSFNYDLYKMMVGKNKVENNYLKFSNQ